MYFHLQKKLLYLAHPRTASRATRDTLLEQAGFEQLTRHGSRRDDLPHHITTEEIRAKTDFDPEEYTVFTTVRNHWDAVLSWYYHLRVPDHGFEPSWLDQFLHKNDIYLPEHGRLWELHRRGADVIMRYENLQQDLNDLLWANGIEPVELKEVGTTDEKAGKHYSEFYDAKMRHAVGSLFSKEIKELGYEFR